MGRAARSTGSIPARAGEPARWRPLPTPDWVYPRACGGPREEGAGRTAMGVYPRACGGTGYKCPHPPGGVGLSPRVRGNPIGVAASIVGNGSIPARAGEPGNVSAMGRIVPVYPRACGGTSGNLRGSMGVLGLSPRVRGNQYNSTRHRPIARSIPARAGEPSRNARDTVSLKVYPRACGGTVPAGLYTLAAPGLSPRVRGNHIRPCPIGPSPGSIPARAGEPD